uniref:P/Homo B domain-containing protein n=1 Tax=Echeneis naucrates TaxID=173247 RepID=A0A665V1W8_ECHNA
RCTPSPCCCLVYLRMARFFALWMGIHLQLCHAIIYTNDWAIRVRGDLQSVNRIADKYGFTNMGQIGELKRYYRFCHHKTANRSSVSNKEVTILIYSLLLRAKLDVPLFAPQHCSDESMGCQPRMNIAAAWRRGHTGKGVVVSVLDDGIEREHPDLKPNYDPLASYDVSGQDQDPSPNYSDNAENYHGTQCAGMVAAAKSSHCTVGVSFHARIGGIRMLDGDVTDIVEAQSLSFRPQYIDIYSASWGPEDDGATLEGPGPLAHLALQNGIKTVRGRRGQRSDHCSCDGYSNSIYTISISSSTRRGSQPDYLEQCTSTLATAYTGMETVTLGPQQGCSQARSGTSLSSSIAAGVIALTLDANPLLTWRDVQHIIIRTSKAHHLVAPDWHINGAGYKVSHLYGFGLLDAESMVKEAERWKQVPSQHECVEEAPIQLSRYQPCCERAPLLVGAFLNSSPFITLDLFLSQSSHGFLSHLFLHTLMGVIFFTAPLLVTLSCASCFPTPLLSPPLAVPLDNSSEGFQNWELMTTHCWGERAAGEWTLKVHDTLSHKRDGTKLGLLLLFVQPYPAHRERARSAEFLMDSDLAEEYSGESCTRAKCHTQLKGLFCKAS